MPVKLIYCCGCQKHVLARLTTGQEVYRHREDLWELPFWKCDACKNFVGCHHKSSERIKPLGCIPTKELKEARKHLHALIDPMWQGGLIARGKLYSEISKATGKAYHTAELRSVEEAREVYRVVLTIRKTLKAKTQ